MKPDGKAGFYGVRRIQPPVFKATALCYHHYRRDDDVKNSGRFWYPTAIVSTNDPFVFALQFDPKASKRVKTHHIKTFALFF